jgi:uncharacterized glyoxalase superfamily protein PhnB
MAAKPIPDGFNSASSYLIVSDAEKALEFYGKAFGAEVGDVMRMPDGSIMHSEVHIGNSTVMITQENPAREMKSAETLGGSPVSMHIYVEDCDKAFERAIAAGCEVAAPVMDAFWGDHYGKVKDPFGIQWGVATHVEDVSPDEMNRRAEEFFASMAQQGSDCQQ